MTDFIVVSYYTFNTEYERAALRLSESLDKLKIPHHIKGIENLGSWDKNTHYKAVFIQDMLNMFPKVNIVFLDADAVVYRPLNMFSCLGVDFAFHFFKERQLASGTLFFKNNNIMRDLVSGWIKQNALNPAAFEQTNLQDVFESQFKDKISYLKLPPEYCKISGLMEYVEDPIVEHFQFSRYNKEEVAIFAKEKKLYSSLWFGDYQPSRCAIPLVRYVDAHATHDMSLLDIGCGDGTTIRGLVGRGYSCTGIDITLDGIKGNRSGFIEAPIWNMPLQDDAKDFTFSTDVLEHIPTIMVPRAIREILRVTKKQTFHCVANFSHVVQGRELHQTRMSTDLWYDAFKKENKKGVAIEIVDRSIFLKRTDIQC